MKLCTMDLEWRNKIEPILEIFQRSRLLTNVAHLFDNNLSLHSLVKNQLSFCYDLSSGILFSSFDVSANFVFSYFIYAPASPWIEYWCCSEHLTASDHAIFYKEDFLAKLGAGYIVFGNVLGWSVFFKKIIVFTNIIIL